MHIDHMNSLKNRRLHQRRYLPNQSMLLFLLAAETIDNVNHSPLYSQQLYVSGRKDGESNSTSDLWPTEFSTHKRNLSMAAVCAVNLKS